MFLKWFGMGRESWKGSWLNKGVTILIDFVIEAMTLLTLSTYIFDSVWCGVASSKPKRGLRHVVCLHA